METNYIKAPQSTQPITITNGKVPRVKRAKREEVPEAYRKKRIAYFAKLKPYLSEILLYFVGLTERKWFK